MCNKDLKSLENLKKGRKCYINQFEDSAYQVVRVEDMFVVHEVSRRDKPEYIGIYHKTEFKKLLNNVYGI